MAVGGMFLGIPLGFWAARLTDPYFATWAILSHASEVKRAFFITAILTALVSGYLSGWLLEKIFRLRPRERTAETRSRKYQVLTWTIAVPLFVYSILGFCTGLTYKGIPEPTVNRASERISIGWKTYSQRQVHPPLRPPWWSPGQPLPGETIEASERTIEIGLFRNRYIKYRGLCLPLPGSTRFGIIAIKETWVNSLSE